MTFNKKGVFIPYWLIYALMLFIGACLSVFFLSLGLIFQALNNPEFLAQLVKGLCS